MKNPILIAVCLCLPILVQSERPRNAEQWRALYNDIFGPVRDDLPLMSGRQITRALDALSQPNLFFYEINENHRNRTQFWFSKIMDNAPEDCSVRFLRNLSDVHERQNTEHNPNFMKLHSVCKKTVIEFCNGLFSDLPSIMASAANETELMRIQDIPTVTHHSETSARGLSKPVLRLIDASPRANSTEIMDAWKAGPCRRILDFLQEPELDLGYSDFVDMCLTNKNETLKYCSEPIQQWVNIVEKCKQVNALMPHITQYLKKERLHGGDLWKDTYKEIFGLKTASTSVMAENELWLAMMFLHSSANRHRSIDIIKRNMVDFWYNALVDFHIEDCEVGTLQTLARLHAEHNTRNNPNFELIHKTAKNNLLKYCRGRFSDFATKLANRLPDRSFVEFLAQAPSSSPPLSNQQLADKLAESVISTIESGRRGAAITQAWAHGPCRFIGRYLRDLSMRQYSSFVNMSLFIGGEYKEHFAETTGVWIRTVGLCRLLDELIPDLARDDSRAYNVRQEVRNLANVLQIGYSNPTPVAAPPIAPASGSNSIRTPTATSTFILPPRVDYPYFSNVSFRELEPVRRVREPSRRGTYNILTPTGRNSKGYWDGDYWRYPNTGRKIPYMN